MQPSEHVVPVNRVLVSVSDKSDLLPFMDFFANRGVDIWSTGGTATMLRDGKIQVTDVADVTRFPECFDGRLKTLHPLVHGGLLYRRDNRDDVARARELGIRPIDLLVGNLYPFEKTVAKPGTTWDTAVENIDIGGPAMIRAAAKNHDYVAVVTSPEQYKEIIAQIVMNGGTTLAFRRKLMHAAYNMCAHYDMAIAAYIRSQNGKI
ncbi:MAG: hypothetical protein KBD06_00100 [Candidatus Pacebacteria bacterium]|nr:hypothetical protein [Candidatus Paceibacterota bacterium]